MQQCRQPQIATCKTQVEPWLGIAELWVGRGRGPTSTRRVRRRCGAGVAPTQVILLAQFRAGPLWLWRSCKV